MLDALHALAHEVSQRLREHELAAHADTLQRASQWALPLEKLANVRGTRRGVTVAAQHLDPALQAARNGPGARLAALLDPLARAGRWAQTSRYVLHPPHPQFLDNYAHTTLLGAPGSDPWAVDETDTVTLGVLLLGPGTLYPHHHHLADEVYVPVTDGWWSHANAQPLQWEPPAVPLHHRPWQPHAAQAAQTHPLLAIYLWTGQRTTSAHFIADECSPFR
ncbi:MAG: dimethylsulfonioproprionate lyase family protein [Allobranchiibius sp.]